MVCTRKPASRSYGLEDLSITATDPGPASGDRGVTPLTPSRAETTSDGEKGSSPSFVDIDRSVDFGDNKSDKRRDGKVETHSERHKPGTKRAAEDEPEAAPPSRCRKIERMTSEERGEIFNYAASFTSRLFNDIEMDILELYDWELRLTSFSTEAVRQMNLAAKLIIEGSGLKYNPRSDIRKLRGGWQRIVSGARNLGQRKKVRRRNVRRGRDLGWWNGSRPKGWVEIRRGQAEITEVLRRMEAALVSKNSD